MREPLLVGGEGFKTRSPPRIHPVGPDYRARGASRSVRPAGIANTNILAEDGRQVLRSPEDWWTIVLGGGFRSIVDQMGPMRPGVVREANLAWIRSQGIASVETNVIYTLARKPQSSGTGGLT